MHESPAFTGAFLFYTCFGFFSGFFALIPDKKSFIAYLYSHEHRIV